MNRIKIVLIAALSGAAAITFSCKKDSTSSAFDKSYDNWLSYKGKVNNTYSYIAFHDETSVHWETKIAIKQGNVVERDFQQYEDIYKPDSNVTRRVLTIQWHESTSDGTLSTHGAQGWGLFTLDDVYYKAQNIWLKASTTTNNITLETNNNGIISTAGYAPKNCKTDDCFIGIHIKSITTN